MNGRLRSLDQMLPAEPLALVRSRVAAEFATVSRAGVPIDSPCLTFTNAALTTIDVGTGVAYPAKAERARANPKVGMLFEGGAGEPVVSIAGYAAVHDADIQANLERYLAETILAPNVDPALVPWENTRRRLYYLARIVVAVAPAHIRWWPNRAAMEHAPHEWRAEPGTAFPVSDPPPTGKPSAAPPWTHRPWPDLAGEAIAGGLPAHLTLLDDAEFPLPMRVRDVQRTASGFGMIVPRGAPWSGGKATLSFAGKEVFVGEAARDGERIALAVERTLPILPMMEERGALKAEVLARLDARLAKEMARRGQPIPVVPPTPPQPSAGALYRAAAAKALDNSKVGSSVAD